MVGRSKLLLLNVAGLLNRGMGAVLGALAQVGYDTVWNCIPASAVGAPHVRDRVWIIADPQCEGRERPVADYRFSIGQDAAFSVDCDGSIGGWCRMAERRAPLRNSDGVRPGVDRSRIKACGNSVVPQIPELIGRAILEAGTA